MSTEELTTDSLEREHAELKLLYDTIRDVSSTLSVREVLDRLLSRVLSHLKSEIASILLIQPDRRLRIVAARGLPSEVMQGTALEIGETVSGLVARTGEPLLVKDIEQDERFHRANHERYYTKSLISAPLLSDGKPHGVINVNNKRSHEPYEARDLKLLEAIAGHASVALNNAREHEYVLERAQHDSLTGLANHGHMWTILEKEADRSNRHGHDLCVVMIDVDKFKDFNDQFGHPAGDEALRAVARELERSSRAHDVVARYGGEEFAVVLPETPLGGGQVYAEKVRQKIEALAIGPTTNGPLTISAGIAASRSGDLSCNDLILLADKRLYRAKSHGRNMCVAEDD